MKAVFHSRYGPPELLEVREVDTPVPGPDQVLVKVQAATVSSGDCNARNLTFVSASMLPIAKLVFGIGKPWKARVLGTELAGEVEAVGRDVRRFKPGDRVFAYTGSAGGAHAQYACLREDAALAPMPRGLGWEEAAALPFGANTALFYLQNLGRIRAGQRLLVIGASGSIGTAAVQLARHFGAEVTGVCSGANVELVRSLGAGAVIDYTREDFTRTEKTYDLILDTVAATTFSRAQGSLTPEGVFLPCIMELTDVLRIISTGLRGGKRLKGGVAVENAARMQVIKDLAEAGALRPVIDRTYPLEGVAEAFNHVEKGHKKGNVVLTVP